MLMCVAVCVSERVCVDVVSCECAAVTDTKSCSLLFESPCVSCFLDAAPAPHFLQVFVTPDWLAMDAMSITRVGWLVGVARAVLLRRRACAP